MLTGDRMPVELMQTLLTSHKGVDLHAATARRVMQRRLSGGEKLADLRRCEFHVFGGAVPSAGGPSRTLAFLLGTGLYYNPNKHSYGHFELDSDFGWDRGSGGDLPAGWPGRPLDSDTGVADASLLDGLLGGRAPQEHVAVDVAAWARGQEGGLVSGTLWRLIVRGGVDEALATGMALAVARSGHEGLLVNPHLENWLVAAGTTGA